MRNLNDSDYLKTENDVREYLHSLSDSKIRSYYKDIEYIAFPILLAHEYSIRFKEKTFKTKK